MDERRGSETEPAMPSQVQFHYVKSPNFRTIHVDGVWGGPAPNLSVHLAVYSERWPIPQSVTYPVNRDGRIGDQEIVKERIAKSGLVREVEADLVMDVNTARVLHQWLGERIEQVMRARADIERQSNEQRGES